MFLSLAGSGITLAQAIPSDVTANSSQASLRPPEPPLEGLLRVDKNTLALTLANQKLLLYDFEFNGDTVPTDKLHLKQLSPGVFEITSIAYTVGEWRVRIRDAASYYGLGERSDTLNHARTVVHNLSQSNAFESGGSRGSTTSKPIPFFMSTTGYGVWFDVTGDATFDLNASSESDILVDADAEKLRILLFTGLGFPKILEAFTAQAGRSTLPPYWAFAPWLGLGSASETQLQETPDKVRSLNLPASVILGGSSAVSPAVIKHLHDEGYKILLHEHPSVSSDSPEYAEAASSGFFVKSPAGTPYIYQTGKESDSFVDFTNLRAKLWWQNRRRQSIQSGADGFQSLASAPIFPTDVKFSDESDVRIMRNRYAILRDGALEEIIEKDLKGNGALLLRNTTTGASGLGFMLYEGGMSSFSPEDGLPTTVTAGLSAGLSGMPLWTAGLGGREADTPLDSRAFMRWIEYAALMPVMESSNALPWEQGDEVLSLYRKFSVLHMSLFPYRYAAAQQSAKTGMPIVRALVLDYQDDKAARQASNEYLFGPDLLVAPIVDQGTQRIVYLPQGDWLDYWTGKPLIGGHVIVADAAIDTIPLFVKQGTILPKIPSDVMTLVPTAESGNKFLKTLDDRRVYELYGSAHSTITDFEGRTLAQSNNSLIVTGESSAHVILRWRFQSIASATVDGVPAKLQTDTLGPFIEFDFKQQSTIAWH